MAPHPIRDILEQRKAGKSAGFYSVCSANRFVIEAAMERARETGTYALVEATANQVNQYGGYTGMKPADFAAFVYDIAGATGLSKEQVILGGDHLGPLVWQEEPEETAMEKADELIRQFVKAGFTKIHLDTSMMLADDDKEKKLSDEVIAKRAARLARVSESEGAAPVYVIGSEVPIPGGAQENDEKISVTTAERFETTCETFKEEFTFAGLEDAFGRIVGVVVQPGVEFSDETVTPYNREAARKLCASLKKYPGLVFEGHSTDYQTRSCLRQMVEDGIAILKVGPALTYALRQALFALCDIEYELLKGKAKTLSRFRDVLEEAMLADPVYWEKYYHDDTASSAAIKRKYSYSDRCRYYLPVKEVVGSIERLLINIDSINVPLSVFEQYMPVQYTHVREGKLEMNAKAIIKDRVKDYIDDYLFAVT